jgi:hypothetical protein
VSAPYEPDLCTISNERAAWRYRLDALRDAVGFIRLVAQTRRAVEVADRLDCFAGDIEDLVRMGELR